MSKADRLRALFPALLSHYWKAQRRVDEHKIEMIMSALRGEKHNCEVCDKLTPAEFLAHV